MAQTKDTAALTMSLNCSGTKAATTSTMISTPSTSCRQCSVMKRSRRNLMLSASTTPSTNAHTGTT